MVANKPDGNRRDRHIQNIQEHSLRVHIDASIGKPQHQQRSHEGRKQRRDHRHAHGISHVTPGEETHDVARDTARAATHEDDADGEIRV